MYNVLILSINITSFLILSLIIHKTERNFKHISVLNVFLFFLSILIFLGSIIGYCYHPIVTNTIRTNISDGIFNRSMLILSLSYLSIAMGVLYFHAILKKPFLLSCKKIIKIKFETNISILLLFAVPFILIAIFYAIKTHFYESLFYAISGDISTAYIIRTQSTNALIQHGFLFTMPFKIIFPIISSFFCLKYISSKKLKYLPLLLFFFLATIFYSIFSVQKYYMFQFFALLLISVYIYKHGLKISLGKIVKYGLILFLLLIIVVMFYVGPTVERIVTIPINLLTRISLANYKVFLAYTDFSTENNLFYGKTFSNVGQLLPYEPISITKIIAKKYFTKPSDIQKNIVGSAPTFYAGEIFLNFGYLGIIFFSFMLGLLLSIINILFNDILLKYSSKDIVIIVVFSFFVVKLTEIITSSMWNMFHYLTILSVGIVIPILILLISSKIKYKYKI